MRQFEPDRTSESRRCTDLFNGRGTGQLQLGDAQQTFDLDLIRIVVASNQHGHGFGSGGIEQRLDELGGIDLQECRHLLNGTAARGADSLQWAKLFLLVSDRGKSFGALDVGSIGSRFAVDDGFSPVSASTMNSWDEVPPINLYRLPRL